MKLKPVEHHPGARLDIFEVLDWYELREAGLVRRFQMALAEAEEFVRQNPALGHPHGFGTRRWPLKIFPYMLIYLDEPEAILVLAVAHFSRSPSYWHHRLAN